MAILPPAVPARLTPAALVYYGLWAAFAGLGVVMFEPLVGGGAPGATVRGVAGAALALEAAALLVERWHLRPLLVDRLLGRTGRRRARRRLLGLVLLALGIVFAGFGALELVRAAQSAL